MLTIYVENCPESEIVKTQGKDVRNYYHGEIFANKYSVGISVSRFSQINNSM